MRKLKPQQKKILDREIRRGVKDVDELSEEVWDKLNKINCFENMYTVVGMYIFEERLTMAQGTNWWKP